MNKKTALKAIYLISAIPVAFGCFYAFFIYAINFGGGDGFFGRENKPVAYLALLFAIALVVVFLAIGKLLYKSYAYNH